MNSSESELIADGRLGALRVDFDVMKLEMNLKSQWNVFSYVIPTE